jgi:ankyrin repeat protein
LKNSNPEVCTALIKAGSDVNARDKDGKCALDYAKENDALKDTDVYWQLHNASFE